MRFGIWIAGLSVVEEAQRVERLSCIGGIYASMVLLETQGLSEGDFSLGIAPSLGVIETQAL